MSVMSRDVKEEKCVPYQYEHQFTSVVFVLSQPGETITAVVLVPVPPAETKQGVVVLVPVQPNLLCLRK